MKKLCGLGLLALASSCGSEAPEPDYACERDSSLIESRLACQTTAACPCGTHCAFGRCTYACKADEDCGQGSCSPFGVCEQGVVASLVRSDEDNYLQVAPSRVGFAREEVETSIAIRLGRLEVESTVRVDSGSARYTVACPGETDFRAQCELSLSPARSSAVVRVRRGDAPIGPSLGRSLHVSTAHRVRSLAIEEDIEAAPAPLLEPAMFRGHMRLAAIVSAEAGRADFEAPLEFPVRVGLGELGPRGHPVGISAPFGLLAGRGDGLLRVGLLRPGEPEPGFEGSSWHTLLRVEHPAFAPNAIYSRVTQLRAMTRSAAGLRFELEQELRIGRKSMRLIWRLALDESGELLEAITPLDRVDLEGEDAAGIEWALEARIREALGLDAVEAPYAKVQAAICSREGRALRFGTELAEGVEKTDTTNRPFVFLDGEVACAQPDELPLPETESALERWPIFPVLMNATVAEDYEAVMVACIDELDGDEGDGGPACHDLGRWLTAASVGLESARTRGQTGVGEAELRAQRVGAYLVHRHLDVLGFIEQIHANQRAFRAHISSSDPAPAGMPSPTGFVERMARARALLLHPRFFGALVDLHPRALSQPDYRLLHAAEAVTDTWSLGEDLHAVPLHVGLLEDGAQRLQGLIELGQEVGQGELAPAAAEVAKLAIGGSVRQIVVFAALAQELKARLVANTRPDVPLFWADAASAVERLLQTRMGALVSSLRPTSLQLEELSLPWFRVGDQGGTGARFRAMTDYLLGSGGELGGVVGYEIGRALDHENQAVARYQRYRSEAFRIRQLEQGVEVRRDDLAIKNGTAIIELCGYDREQYQARGAYAALDAEPNPNRCYIDSRSACAANLREPTVPEAAMKLCRAGYLAQRAGLAGFADLAAFERLPDGFERDLRAEDVQVAQLGPGVFEARLVRPTAELSAELGLLDAYFAELQARGESATLFSEVELVCGEVFDRVRAALPEEDCDPDPLAARQAGDEAVGCAESASYHRGLGEADPSCFKGQLGNGVLAIRSAELAIREAEAEFARLVTDGEVAIANCNLEAARAEQVKSLHESFIQRMEKLRAARAKAQTISAAASATSNCLSAVQKVDPSKFWSLGQSAAIVGGICAAETVVALQEAELASIEQDIDNAQDRLSADLDILDAETEWRKCENGLRSVFAHLPPAGLRIREAVSRYAQSTARFRDMQDQLQRLYDEGKQWSANLDKRSLKAVPQDFGFLERFAAVEDAIERVQRALIYATRAAQYELQQSVASVAQIRRTRTVLDLEALALDLRDTVQSGVVRGGGAATETRLIVSLRDDILRIPGPGEQPAGFHALPRGVAFRDVLTHPSRRVYDAAGRFIGIGIRFGFAPEALDDGRTGLGEHLAGRLCAERIWASGAVIAGAEAVEFGGSVVSRMFLRKRNGFQSQRCAVDGGPVAGFIDPGSLALGQHPDAASVRDRYTNALLSASVWRGDLVSGARVAIEQGRQSVRMSKEHAGWGLYGDYELFIPVESIGQDKLRIENIKDILLVFDLVVVSPSG